MFNNNNITTQYTGDREKERTAPIISYANAMIDVAS